MRQLLLTLFVLCMCIVRVSAQEITQKESSVYLTGSTGMSSHNLILAIAKIEYNRQISGNWFWGASIQNNFGIGRARTYDWNGVGLSPYRNTVRQNIFLISGMSYYCIPVVRKWLSLRVGAGLGLGYHQMHEHADNDSMLKDKVLPYLNTELAWIVKLSKCVDIKLAPTLVGAPQSFSYSPIKLGEPTDVSSMIYDIGFNIGFGIRF